METFFPKYSEGIPSLQIMMISLIPLTIGAVFNAKLQAQESTRVGFSAIVRIGTLLFLIVFLGNYYGLMGISFAVLLSTIFYVIFLFILYTKAKNQNNS